MSENKKKYAYWMKPSMVEEMTEMLDTANATSKSDFVCQAVNFYIGYLHQQKCIDYLSPMLAQTIKSEIESVEKNISEMLFKLAVEQAKLSNVVAATNKIDNHSLSALNNLCAEEVARKNGIITFEDVQIPTRLINAEDYFYKPIYEKSCIFKCRQTNKIYGHS